MKVIFVFIIGSIFSLQVFAQKTYPIRLVIHGGAGTLKKENMTEEKEKAYKKALEEALYAGYAVLESGGKATDAIQASIVVLEDCPLFNAGKGAVFTAQGTNELDASIMRGEDLMSGAVAGVSIVKNPIKLAYEIMVNSPHVMMVGNGAHLFAQKRGLEIVDPSYFYTEERFGQLQKIQKQEQPPTESEKNNKKEEGEQPRKNHKFGTVGAVALDMYGNIAAGTSTGGMTNKKYGRVGDTPIIGAGTYADNTTCGVSSTGHGEFFIRAVVAYDISARMKYKNLSLQQAADEVVMNTLKKMGGEGGIIALDRKGNIVMVFNTEGMYRGFIKEKNKACTYIYK
ncbi:MAG: isoaspartyl peptidase/L-asparaginase [Chitinophagaceae bacterium]|nr:isoaspartyl peptidase/L-asparaginase [Chitinophagaceae bacterium]